MMQPPSLRGLVFRLAPALAAAGLLATAAASASAPPASPGAQKPAAAPAPGGVGTSNEPIDVTSDNYDYRQQERVGVWTGNVEAVQGVARLRTPKLTVYFAPRDPNAPKPPPGSAQADVGQVERMEAEGPVHYTTPTQRALGDHGTYIADGDTITLTGNVVVVQDKNVATGDKLVIEQKTGHSVLTSNPGKSAPQRVRAVLYPNQNNQTQGASSAQPPKPAVHP
jgi:lipopolysaccharide export system protein LptA